MGIFDLFRKKSEPEKACSHPGRLEKLGYPYTMLPEKLTYEALMQYYWDARERGRREGFTPVLVKADDVLDDFLQFMEEDGYSLEEARRKSESLDGKTILEERLKVLIEPDDPECESLLMDEVFLGTLENGDELNYFGVLYSDHNRIALFELPTLNPWEAVLYIPFGGWNECPLPEEHAAILKYWYDKWGAVPAFITSDTVELVLPAPIPKEQVWDVAKEHFAYTEDSVSQGTGTLGALADGLWKSNVWFFWWD